jgi:membrane-associated phospholipid phosphatase
MNEVIPNRVRNGLRIGSIILLVLLLWLVGEVMNHKTQAFDSSVTAFIDTSRSPQFTRAMGIITRFGKEVIFEASSIITIWFLATRRWKELGYYAILVGGGEILNSVLKVLINRTRPTLDVLIHEPGKSFPSGHSMASIIFYSLIVYGVWYFTMNKKLTWLTGFIAMILVLAIGVSRVYLGAHFPSDVLGGYLAGILWIFVICF